ncbi:MAG: AMP-dependent synthetase/ligase [Myxococcota bacterium]
MTTAADISRSTGPSIHLVDVFLSTVGRHAHEAGAQFERDGTWQTATWQEMADRARRYAFGLVALGVEPGDRVNVIGDTSLPWVLAELGVQMAGGISVPIYQTNPAEDVRYVVDDSEAVLAIATDEEQVAKFRQVRERLPRLRHVVALGGGADGDFVLGEDDLVARGEELEREQPNVVDERTASIAPDDAACFIYTSGTTGPPKGVMLTHRTWAFEADAIEQLGLIGPDDVQLLFLPLAHSFAQVLKTAWLKTGHRLAFVPDVDRIVDSMSAVKPTVMASVPRIFEKIYTKVVSSGMEAPGVKGRLFRWGMGHFDAYVHARQEGREYHGLGWNLARRLVFAKVAARLDELFGGRLRFFISGGAPLATRIAYFFELADVMILEGYGLTETAAATCVNRPGRMKIGTVGLPVPGMEVRVAGDGELLLRGGGVMKGYWKHPDATREAIDEDGWFHSGDVGEVDEDGFVRITDRKKDIIVTAGGKNVAPQNLENELKTHPLISQVLVHGDKRKFLTALVALDEASATAWAKERTLDFSDLTELAGHEAIQGEIGRAVDTLNANLPSYLTIKRFAIVDHDFTQETGELTPTLKVKRRVVEQRYGEVLDRLYADVA